jgi:hypothetical protein
VKAVCKSMLVGGLAAVALGGCEQPKPNCLTSQNSFVMKLSEQSKNESVPGACDAAGAGLASFYADPHVGISPYYKRDKKGQPDYRKGSVAIRTAELATFYDNALARDVEPTVSTLHSIGDFNSEEPDSNDICTAPDLADTRVVISELPPVADDPATKDDEARPAQRAIDVTRKWRNLQVYITADSFGTQVQADLEDRWVAPTGGTCTLTYKALGLSPAVSCAKTDPETEVPLTNADGTFQVDPSLCSPDPDPAAGRYFGSGIGPSAKTVCDPAIGYCVLEGTAFPALK